MHVKLTADSHETLGGLLGALIKEKTPEDGVLMISCARPSSGGFIATVDIGGPESEAIAP